MVRKESKEVNGLKRKIIGDRKRPFGHDNSSMEILAFRNRLRETLKAKFKCPKERLKAIHDRLKQ